MMAAAASSTDRKVAGLADGPEMQLVAVASSAGSGRDGGPASFTGPEVPRDAICRPVTPAPSPSKSVEMGRCKWECGPARPVSELFRTNAQAAWECHPCYCGHRALKSACRTEDDKKALAQLNKEDPEGYKAKVRACAIHTPGRATREQTKARAALAVRQVTVIRQVVNVMAKAGVKFVDEAGYTRRFKKHGVTEEELSEQFRAKVADDSVHRVPDGNGGWLIPVPKYPTLEVGHGREFERNVGSVDRMITTDQEAAEALRDVSSVGTGASALAGPVFGDMGQALRPMGMVGASNLPSLGEAAREPPRAAVFGELAPHSDPVRAPEGEELQKPTPKKRPGVRKALANSYGVVLARRKEGLEIVDRVKEDHGKATNSLPGRIQRATKGKAGGPTRDMAPKMAEHKFLVDAVAAEGKEVGKWVLDDSEVKLQSLREKAARLAELHGELGELLDRWQENHSQDRDVREAFKKKEAREKVRRSSVYSDTVPKRVLSWLDDKGFWNTEPPRTFGRVSVHSPGTDEVSTWEPRVFLARDTEAGAGQQVHQAVDSLGRERLDRETRELMSLVDEMPKMEGKGESIVRPYGPGTDTYTDARWVPAKWREAGVLPTELSGCGAPWLLAERAASWRTDFYHTPLPGVGQFWQQRLGSRLVLLWPVNSVTELGAECQNAWYWLFDEIPTVTFKEHASVNVAVARLDAGDGLWVPFGWQVATLSLQQGRVVGGAAAYGSAVVMPFLCKGLAEQCASMALVAGHLKAQVDISIQDKCEPWPRVGRDLEDWLNRIVSNLRPGEQKSLKVGDAMSERAEKVRMGQRQLTKRISDALHPPVSQQATAGSVADVEDVTLLAEETADMDVNVGWVETEVPTAEMDATVRGILGPDVEADPKAEDARGGPEVEPRGAVGGDETRAREEEGPGAAAGVAEGDGGTPARGRGSTGRVRRTTRCRTTDADAAESGTGRGTGRGRGRGRSARKDRRAAQLVGRGGVAVADQKLVKGRLGRTARGDRAGRRRRASGPVAKRRRTGAEARAPAAQAAS